MLVLHFYAGDDWIRLGTAQPPAMLQGCLKNDLASPLEGLFRPPFNFRSSIECETPSACPR